tara:strand:- start:92 stop:1195 length:1104 start_codon:yes stop_codon:yes gene_type:complete
MKNIIVLLLLFIRVNSYCQVIEQVDSLSLIFIGDIMGHDSQIKSAFDNETNNYNYESVFNKVSPIIEKADFAIANLEVTLAGEPYKGYPQFSSPDELAVSCKISGIDILVTSNNHSCDRGKNGILRTINILDSLEIPHTGTFKDSLDRINHNLLILNKNNIKVGLLNYTYGTNGISTPEPTIVNRIDKLTMLSDIQNSKEAFLDKLIVMIHWGNEYQSQPSSNQIELAEFLFKNGVDIIIGSHPHVLQKMEFAKKNEEHNERLIAYSLGNFVSAQRTRKRDGGAMFELTLERRNNEVHISKCGYYLTWVNQPIINGITKFEIVPCSIMETDLNKELDYNSKEKMKIFLFDSRALLETENKNVNEIKN